MNNKAHLRPKDYDSNGDIIPSGWKEEKGDLISREALKKALNFVYDCAYIDSKSKEGIVSDIIDEIDNVPTKRPCENCDLYFKAMTKEEIRKGGAE